ncbi:MCE family protein [Nocardioides nitrophenolicus]|uniref:MCE family protein n=1 Tax=Nocardioides nitrophenolicus TaxID=60489 RepID=UPI00195852BA|nr:MCE family protein [Nocardioides nitrophenolicus]MBM7515177.1 phospholipid/cholesterol/gamma-HCH transport system substrate-binding protein [Nocardioides nitrophenolicus]
MTAMRTTARTGRTLALRGALVALLALALGVMSACSTTMRDLPIPGTGVSGDTIEIKAQFDDALNLAVGAPVKVNGVDMGKVKSIEAADFTASATLTVKKDAEVREGAQARLRYTTPLGELFVDVTNPASGTVLADQAVLTRESTTTAPSVEDALAQASLLINGGGLDQLQTVTEELNTALNGNEADYRALLDKASVFLTQANSTTQAIDSVLTSMNSLSTTLNGRKKTINRALKDIRPAAEVLREKTPAFTELLAEVEKFSGAANDTVTKTRTQLLTMLSELEPVLAEFAANNGTFERSLQAVIKASGSADAVIGTDYLNIALELHVDNLNVNGLLNGTVNGVVTGLLGLIGLDDLLPNLPLLGGNKTGGAKSGAKGGGTPATGSPGGTGGTGATSTDPLGLGGLLGNLFGRGA